MLWGAVRRVKPISRLSRLTAYGSRLTQLAANTCRAELSWPERLAIQRSRRQVREPSARDALVIVLRAELDERGERLGKGLHALRRGIGHVCRRLAFAIEPLD